VQENWYGEGEPHKIGRPEPCNTLGDEALRCVAHHEVCADKRDVGIGQHKAGQNEEKRHRLVAEVGEPARKYRVGQVVVENDDEKRRKGSATKLRQARWLSARPFF